MNNEFDVIIPVGVKDVMLVTTNVVHINKNIKPQKIYLITSLDNINKLKTKKLPDNVVLLNEDEICKDITYEKVDKLVKNKYGKSYSGGWFFQQFLKISFAQTKYAKTYYLAWDADTIPINKITFFAEDKILINPKKEYNKSYFIMIKKLLNIDRQVDYSFISEHLMINTSIMNEMIQKISSRLDGEPSIYDRILSFLQKDNFNCFSEYETYGNYMALYHPNKFKLRELRTFRTCAKFYGRNLNKEDDIKDLRLDFDSISLELRDMKKSPILYIRLNYYCIKLMQFFRKLNVIIC